MRLFLMNNHEKNAFEGKPDVNRRRTAVRKKLIESLKNRQSN